MTDVASPVKQNSLCQDSLKQVCSSCLPVDIGKDTRLFSPHGSGQDNIGQLSRLVFKDVLGDNLRQEREHELTSKMKPRQYSQIILGRSRYLGSCRAWAETQPGWYR